jgi:hypothetical protein
MLSEAVEVAGLAIFREGPGMPPTKLTELGFVGFVSSGSGVFSIFRPFGVQASQREVLI